LLHPAVSFVLLRAGVVGMVVMILAIIGCAVLAGVIAALVDLAVKRNW